MNTSRTVNLLAFKVHQTAPRQHTLLRSGTHTHHFTIQAHVLFLLSVIYVACDIECSEKQYQIIAIGIEMGDQTTYIHQSAIFCFLSQLDLQNLFWISRNLRYQFSFSSFFLLFWYCQQQSFASIWTNCFCCSRLLEAS